MNRKERRGTLARVRSGAEMTREEMSSTVASLVRGVSNGLPGYDVTIMVTKVLSAQGTGPADQRVAANLVYDSTLPWTAARIMMEGLLRSQA